MIFLAESYLDYLQALSSHEKSLKTAKQLHKLRSFPQRKFAVKA